jgi:hypothetical protein
VNAEDQVEDILKEKLTERDISYKMSERYNYYIIGLEVAILYVVIKGNFDIASISISANHEVPSWLLSLLVWCLGGMATLSGLFWLWMISTGQNYYVASLTFWYALMKNVKDAEIKVQAGAARNIEEALEPTNHKDLTELWKKYIALAQNYASKYKRVKVPYILFVSTSVSFFALIFASGIVKLVLIKR